MSLPQIKVAQVCLEYVPSFGGSAKTVNDFRRALGDVIISFTSSGNKGQTPEWNKDICNVPISKGILGKYYAWPVSKDELYKANNILHKSDLAIIHLLYRYHYQWAGALAGKIKIPYWVIPHGGLDPYVFTYGSLQKKTWMSVLGHPIMRRAQAVIFATEREREKALPYTKGCKTHVLHWPVEYVDISGRAEMRALVRARHRIPDGARVLFWIGRLDVMKRPLQTIEAFGKIDNPLVHLMMIGPDGSLTRRDCERFCAERNISNVHLIRPVYGDEKYQYYMASDAYISLSFRENFNYTAAEAMGCGLPVILSPGNDLGHELRDLNCGWMLKTSAEQECLDALDQFVSMPQMLLDEMGLSGMRWARNALSWETFAQSLRKLADEATNNH